MPVKFEQKTWTHALGGKAYRDNFDQAFGKKKKPKAKGKKNGK